jgi:hypothetical protein
LGHWNTEHQSGDFLVWYSISGDLVLHWLFLNFFDAGPLSFLCAVLLNLQYLHFILKMNCLTLWSQSPSVLAFSLWGWDWCLTGLHPLLRAFCPSPDEIDEWMKEWMKLMKWMNVEHMVEWYWQGKTEELEDKPV